MKNLFVMFAVFSMILMSCTDDSVSKENVESYIVEKTVHEERVVYNALNNNGELVSKLTLRYDNVVEVQFAEQNEPIKDVQYKLLDSNGDIIEQKSILAESQEKWVHIAAAIVLLCVHGEVGYDDGWYGHIGFDCFAIANPGENEYPKTYAPIFRIDPK